jgi:hypothetical protein
MSRQQQHHFNTHSRATNNSAIKIHQQQATTNSEVTQPEETYPYATLAARRKLLRMQQMIGNVPF